MNPNDRNPGSSSRPAKAKRRAEPETPSNPSFKVDVSHTGFPPQYPPDYEVQISPKGFSLTITHPGSSSQAPQPGSSSQAPQPGSSSQAPYQPFVNPQFPQPDWGAPYQPQYAPNFGAVQDDGPDEGELSPTQMEEDIKFYTAPHGHLRGKRLQDALKRKTKIRAKYGLDF